RECMATVINRRPVNERSVEGKHDGVGPNMGELLELLGFNLALVNAMFIRDANAACSEVSISAKQFTVLSLIANNHGIAQVDIANALMTDRATMMAIVDRLEARGLITRERSLVDRRRQHLILTAKGMEALAHARRAVKRSEQKLTRNLSPEEIVQLISVLTRLRSRR